MRSFFGALLVVAAIFFPASVTGDDVQVAGIPVDSSYLESRVPRRLALVVGNSEYVELGDLPGVESDVARMSATFQQMGFDLVVSAPNVPDMKTLQSDVLVPFRKKVERDDLVVIYFSGHGFAYGGNQYFAPSGIPRQVVEGQVARNALPIESLVDFFDEEGPGALLLIVDACRTIGDFVIKAADGTELPKGENDGQRKSTNINYILALSVGSGLPSIGSSNPGTMSVYSGVLVDALDEGIDFRLLHDEVEFEVAERTQERQIPGLHEFSMTDIVLSFGDEWLQRERERWESLLVDGDPRKIRKFAAMKTLSPYVRAARRWLDQNGQREIVADIAPVSPSAIEEGWALAEGRLVALSSALSFSRIQLQPFAGVAAQEPGLDKETILSRIGLADAGTGSTNVSVDTGQWLEQLGRQINGGSAEAVLAGQVLLRPAPGNLVTTRMTNLRIPRSVDRVFMGATRDVLGEPQYWVSVDTDLGEKYLTLAASSISQIDIGTPAEEVTLPARQAAPEGLADLGDLDRVAQSLQIRGQSISWASIAAPSSAGWTEDQVAENEFRIANVQWRLMQLGVERSRITVVTVDQADGSEAIRVRLFSRNNQS